MLFFIDLTFIITLKIITCHFICQLDHQVYQRDTFSLFLNIFCSVYILYFFLYIITNYSLQRANIFTK